MYLWSLLLAITSSILLKCTNAKICYPSSMSSTCSRTSTSDSSNYDLSADTASDVSVSASNETNINCSLRKAAIKALKSRSKHSKKALIKLFAKRIEIDSRGLDLLNEVCPKLKYRLTISILRKLNLAIRERISSECYRHVYQNMKKKEDFTSVPLKFLPILFTQTTNYGVQQKACHHILLSKHKDLANGLDECLSCKATMFKVPGQSSLFLNPRCILKQPELVDDVLTACKKTLRLSMN